MVCVIILLTVTVAYEIPQTLGDTVLMPRVGGGDVMGTVVTNDPTEL